MATPKVIHYDITIHIPYLEKQLEALIYLGEKVLSIATAAQRLIELGFQEFAYAHPELHFFVTRIGCGLAGFTDEEMTPLFIGAPSNCDLPHGWR